MIIARLASLGRWRWASSVALVLAACVPALSAALLIPGEIAPPWNDARISLPRAPHRSEPVRSDATFDSRDDGLPDSAPVAVPAAAPVALRDVTHRAPPRPETRREGSRGIFVPPGETDDSEPVATRAVAEP